MPAYDEVTKTKSSVAIGPTDGAGITVGPEVGSIIDTKDFESLTWVVQAGTITTGTFTVVLEEGDDSGLSDAAVVAAAEVLSATGATGSLPALTGAQSDSTVSVGVVGKKRFQRLSLLGSNTPLGDLNAVAVQGHARSSPQS